MMGYVTAMAPCIGCRRIFSFNAVKVPSITYNGTRQAICADCVARVNPMRKANGLEPIVPMHDAMTPATRARSSNGHCRVPTNGGC
jgi:hypothetical protein